MDSFDKVLKTFKRAKQDLGEVLSSCELIDALSMDAVCTATKRKAPLGDHPFYMMVETSGSNNDHDEQKMNKFLVDVLDSGIVLDGTVTNEPSKMRVSFLYNYLPI